MYVLSYILAMLSSLIYDYSPFKILKALHYSPTGSSLRELSQLTGLSIGAVQDNTKKLLELGLIKKTAKSNKVFFFLSMKEDDEKLFCQLLADSEKLRLSIKAESTSTKKLVSILNLGQELSKVRKAHGTA